MRSKRIAQRVSLSYKYVYPTFCEAYREAWGGPTQMSRQSEVMHSLVSERSRSNYCSTVIVQSPSARISRR